jgi:hypothetical protein
MITSARSIFPSGPRTSISTYGHNPDRRVRNLAIPFAWSGIGSAARRHSRSSVKDQLRPGPAPVLQFGQPSPRSSEPAFPHWRVPLRVPRTPISTLANPGSAAPKVCFPLWSMVVQAAEPASTKYETSPWSDQEEVSAFSAGTGPSYLGLVSLAGVSGVGALSKYRSCWSRSRGKSCLIAPRLLSKTDKAWSSLSVT